MAQQAGRLTARPGFRVSRSFGYPVLQRATAGVFLMVPAQGRGGPNLCQPQVSWHGKAAGCTGRCLRWSSPEHQGFGVPSPTAAGLGAIIPLALITGCGWLPGSVPHVKDRGILRADEPTPSSAARMGMGEQGAQTPPGAGMHWWQRARDGDRTWLYGRHCHNSTKSAAEGFADGHPSPSRDEQHQGVEPADDQPG